MDFGVIIALRDSKLAYATESFIYLESNAVFLHNFWRPQPTLPYFASLRKQAWRNHKEGRVVCLHQNIFTRKVTHLPPTFAIILHIPRPLRPCFWRPRVPVPHVPTLMSSSSSSRVPKSQVPTHTSRCPRPLVSVPLFYTAHRNQWLAILISQIFLAKTWHYADSLFTKATRRVLPSPRSSFQELFHKKNII